MSFLRTPFKLPLALFLVGALVGVWASYDTEASWDKFILIVAAVIIYLVAANLRGWTRTAIIWGALTVAAVFALYFASQHDFAADPAKLQVVSTLGEGLNRLIPQFGYHVPQPNIAAGALEVAIPFGIALACQRLFERKWAESVLAVILSVLIGLGLVLTSSRGAWLALGLVLIFAAVVFVARKLFKYLHLSNRLLAPLFLNLLLIAVLLLLHFWDGGRLLDSVGTITAGDRSVSRLQVYGQASQLIQDYGFTGIGLGVFPMVFSTYALLIDVPFLSHSHNLFLQVWIEQGILGFLAFAWLVLSYYYWVWHRRDRLNWLALGGIAATTVMLLHGFVDVLLYSSRFLPLMFLPMGVTVAALRRRGVAPRFSLATYKPAIALGMAVLVAGAVTLGVERDTIFAAWFADMGSVEQTRVELSNYHFADALVEYVRREVDLSPAEENFAQALVLDEWNVTAGQRLASIELARGNYAKALDYVQAAEKRDPESAVTHELLAEAYLGTGQIDKAFTYWCGISDGAARLDRLSKVRFQREGDIQRAGWAMAMAERFRSCQD